MANLACYPAINLPNGFSETGSPTNMTVFAAYRNGDPRAGEGVSGCGRIHLAAHALDSDEGHFLDRLASS